MAQPELDDLIETFSFLEDWEDRYAHIIDLGKTLPVMDDTLKTATTKVDGCASQVWLYPFTQGDDKAARFDFVADSDAIIVRGLIAILHIIYAGRTVSEIQTLNTEAIFQQLGLEDHLSAQRSNGFRAMVQRIRQVAETSRC